MLAVDLISDIIPHLRTSDTGQAALNLMELFRVSHLPIVNNSEFLGLISDKDIYDTNTAEEPIGGHNLSLYKPYVFNNQHIFEIIEVVSRLKLSLIPVLDKKNNDFLGVISASDLIHNFANLTSVNHPGAIIVLELNQNDYYLSQIVQIVETNDAKILSSYITSSNNSTKIELTLKLNITDISRITQSLTRYNYDIKNTYIEENTMGDLYRNRFDSFLNYLNL